ncbi:hypothetical protein [Penaeicola halotolerans]|uniref:hypothetical protein n=1 Tax=Penaeicola halotolerans TaxID=2793196 RepID=UPI001CF8FD27|nr:hypothetical protein [Penaeicola halotolerans]
MKKIIGIVLILVGVGAFFFTGMSFTTSENVIDVGPIEINREKENELNWPPIAGGVIAVIGLFTLLSGIKSKS